MSLDLGCSTGRRRRQAADVSTGRGQSTWRGGRGGRAGVRRRGEPWGAPGGPHRRPAACPRMPPHSRRPGARQRCGMGTMQAAGGCQAPPRCCGAAAATTSTPRAGRAAQPCAWAASLHGCAPPAPAARTHGGWRSTHLASRRKRARQARPAHFGALACCATCCAVPLLARSLGASHGCFTGGIAPFLDRWHRQGRAAGRPGCTRPRTLSPRSRWALAGCPTPPYMPMTTIRARLDRRRHRCTPPSCSLRPAARLPPSARACASGPPWLAGGSVCLPHPSGWPAAAIMMLTQGRSRAATAPPAPDLRAIIMQPASPLPTPPSPSPCAPLPHCARGAQFGHTGRLNLPFASACKCRAIKQQAEQVQQANWRAATDPRRRPLHAGPRPSPPLPAACPPPDSHSALVGSFNAH